MQDSWNVPFVTAAGALFHDNTVAYKLNIVEHADNEQGGMQSTHCDCIREHGNSE